jgi:hypothetical protein
MKSIFLILLFIASSFPAFSVNETSPANQEPNTIQQQYKNLKSDLEIIDGFRMIKMYTMDKFWTTVEDSLQAQRSKLTELAAQITKQKEDIRNLNVSLSEIEKEKQSLATGVDSLIIFGKPYSKVGFITLVSFVMVGLLVLIGILFSVSRVSMYTTRELRKLNESLYQEFDTYKRNSVEKEIKLSRELQNHRNKLAELKMV